jgi:hypothetical protein
MLNFAHFFKVLLFPLTGGVKNLTTRSNQIPLSCGMVLLIHSCGNVVFGTKLGHSVAGRSYQIP